MRFRQRVFNKKIIAIVLAAVMSFTAVFTSSAQTRRVHSNNNIKQQKVVQAIEEITFNDIFSITIIIQSEHCSCADCK